jgi:hypothetical protein
LFTWTAHPQNSVKFQSEIVTQTQNNSYNQNIWPSCHIFLFTMCCSCKQENVTGGSNILIVEVILCLCHYFRLKFDTVLRMCCSCKQENVTGGSNILIVGSVLWCPWRFPHRDCVRFVFASGCLREPHVLFTLFLFVCARGGIQHMFLNLQPLKRKTLLSVVFWWPIPIHNLSISLWQSRRLFDYVPLTCRKSLTNVIT